MSLVPAAADDAPPPVTVVIPAGNAAATLGACLDALAREGVPGPGAELVVVDDRSTDGTATVATRPGVQVIQGPGTGPAGARNAGTATARGEVVVFLDADTVPASGWLREMLDPMKDERVVAVKGRYQTLQRAPLARFAQLEFEWKYERLQRASRVDYVDTGTAAFRRSSLVESGGFDETLRASEDVELAFRLASRGGLFVFNPRAVVFHRHTEDFVGYFRKKIRAAQTRTLVYRRHPGKTLGDSYTPPLMGAQIVLAAASSAGVAGRLIGLPSGVMMAPLAVFLLSTLPLVKQALRFDRGLAPLVPALVYVRAVAQAVGMGAAVASWMTRAGAKPQVSQE